MVKKLLSVLVIFLSLDFLWLGLIAKSFYDKELSSFSRRLNLPAAVLAYALIALGIALFVLPKASGKPSLAFWWGAFFGLAVYGVYDLVNLATLADWPLKMALVDMVWGMCVCGLTSFFTVHLLNLLK